MQLELSVAVAVRTLLLVEGLVYKLHCSVLALETFYHLWHKSLQFCLAWILHQHLILRRKDGE